MAQNVEKNVSKRPKNAFFEHFLDFWVIFGPDKPNWAILPAQKGGKMQKNAKNNFNVIFEL